MLFFENNNLWSHRQNRPQIDQVMAEIHVLSKIFPALLFHYSKERKCSDYAVFVCLDSFQTSGE